MPTMSQRDVLRRMEDGYYLIQPVSYGDTEPPFYLVKDEMILANARSRAGIERHTDDKELVPRNIAKKLIASGALEMTRTSNWTRYKKVAQ